MATLPPERVMPGLTEDEVNAEWDAAWMRTIVGSIGAGKSRPDAPMVAIGEFLAAQVESPDA